MNQLDKEQMHLHVTILGWLHIVAHAVLILVGVLVFMLLLGVGMASGYREAMPILTAVGFGVGLFLVLLSLPGILAGYGLLRRWSWARILAMVIGVLDLTAFPVGTALGVYTLWVLLQNSATEYFSAMGEV